MPITGTAVHLIQKLCLKSEASTATNVFIDAMIL